MKSLDNLYNQFYLLLAKMDNHAENEIKTNLLQYGIAPEYYERVDNAAALIVDFYTKYLTSDEFQKGVHEILKDERKENVKFCLLIDILRCYDGLDHPTSFTTPEGIAFMILLAKLLGKSEKISYEKLASVPASILALIDIIPSINECSEELGNKYSLLLSSIIEPIDSSIDRLYRMLLYNLCKRIAEVDGEISISEQEWLNEIALLNDDNPDTDIDVRDI